MGIPEKIRYNYIKSNYFRIVHVDGGHGGITPHGQIMFSVYNERAPIPQVTVHKIEKDGKIGEENRAERVSKEGLVREVEIGLLMDLSTAENIHRWFGQKIDELKGLLKQAQETRE